MSGQYKRLCIVIKTTWAVPRQLFTCLCDVVNTKAALCTSRYRPRTTYCRRSLRPQSQMFHGAKPFLKSSASSFCPQHFRSVGFVASSFNKGLRPTPCPPRAGGFDFIARAGEEAKENWSNEANDYVSDIVEVDRTFELLSWIWSSITSKEQDRVTCADEDLAPAYFQRDEEDWPAVTEVAVFGGGCFWCLEACFQLAEGVLRVENGYAGGKTAEPTYFEVSSGHTGHAEVVRVTYDPSQISYTDLLRMFFSLHDPTTKDRQGDDVGPQYRSIILTQNEQQQKVAEQVMAEVGRTLSRPLVTQLQPAATFYEADEYHQAYYMRNPGKGYCVMVVGPKVASFKVEHAEKVRRYAQ